MPEKFRPGAFKAGSADDQLLQHIDITATSLALAGIEPPAAMQGRVFLGGSAAPEPEFAFSARDRCDETVDRIRCVRTRRWKLIRNFLPERPYSQKNHYKDTSYPALQVMRQLHAEGRLEGAAAQWMAPARPELELYDLEADPHEVDNLARDERHAPTLERLAGALDAWIESSGDRGRIPEDPLPAEYSLRTMVDGWYTNSGRLSRSGGALRMDWEGRPRPPEVVVPWIEPGGPLRLSLEMRSETALNLTVRWGSPGRMGGAGSIEVGLAAGSDWKRLEADLDCEGWLAWFSIRFPAESRVAECRRAALERRDPAGVVRRVVVRVRRSSFRGCRISPP